MLVTGMRDKYLVIDEDEVGFELETKRVKKDKDTNH